MTEKCFKLLILALLLSLLFPADGCAILQKPYNIEPTADVWNTYDPALHYFYQQLTDAEKRLFSARYDALALGDASLWNYQVSSLNSLSQGELCDYQRLPGIDVYSRIGKPL